MIQYQSFDDSQTSLLRDRDASAWAELLAKQESASKIKKRTSFNIPMSESDERPSRPTPSADPLMAHTSSTPGKRKSVGRENDSMIAGISGISNTTTVRQSPSKAGDTSFRSTGSSGDNGTTGRVTDEFKAISDGGFHANYWKTKYMR